MDHEEKHLSRRGFLTAAIAAVPALAFVAAAAEPAQARGGPDAFTRPQGSTDTKSKTKDTKKEGHHRKRKVIVSKGHGRKVIVKKHPRRFHSNHSFGFSSRRHRSFRSRRGVFIKKGFKF